MRRAVRVLGMMASAGAVYLASIAWPQPFARVVEDIPQSEEVRIEIRGEIAPRCEMAWADLGSALGLGVLNNAPGGELGSGEARIGFALECNQPFRYAVRAEEGALRREGGAEGADTVFLTEVPYTAQIEFGGGGGVSCASDGLATPEGCALIGREAVTNDTGELRVSWQAQPRPLLAGRYADRLHISVAPLISGE